MITAAVGLAALDLGGGFDRPEPGYRADATLVGVLMIILACGLWGRRRLAHRAALATLAAAMIASIGTGHPPWAAGFGLGLAALWPLRDRFPVRADPHRHRIAALVLGTALTISDRWLLRADGYWPFAPAHPSSAAIAPLVDRFLSLAVLGLGLAALVVAFTPGKPPPAGSPAQRATVAALVEHPDADTLAPFCTRADRSYAFSPDHRAVLGYRVLFGTAIVGGDPVGAPEAAPAAIAGFLDCCRQQGWRPAVLGASDNSRPLWRAAGLRHGVIVGDEAIIDLAEFSMTTRRMRNLRQAVRRTHNAGVRVTVGRLDEDLGNTLRPVLDEWLRGRGERGFSMNLDQVLVPRPDCVVAVAYDRAGHAQAFARFVTAGGGRVLTLDVSPRRRHAPNGVTERLVAEVIEYGREHAVREVSLNFAGLRQVLTATNPLGRVARGMIRLGDHWIQLAPLYFFLTKFRPRWQARWLLLRSWTEIGWVLPAALLAEFASAPRAADRPSRPEPAPLSPPTVLP